MRALQSVAEAANGVDDRGRAPSHSTVSGGDDFDCSSRIIRASRITEGVIEIRVGNVHALEVGRIDAEPLFVDLM